jgi:S-adenosylmethionine:tRNA ribosyltransferase-isomerase
MVIDGAALRDTSTFDLPPERFALEPPEVRGLPRDRVRLLVSRLADRRISHHLFSDLPDLLDPGDLVIVNTSATVPASLPARARSGEEFELHLSTHLPGDVWTVELRTPRPEGSAPFADVAEGERLALPGGGWLRLLARYAKDRRAGSSRRIWVAALDLPADLGDYLAAHGSPISYSGRRFDLGYYQTVFATEPGGAEMPSAGRPFSHELVTRLVSRGIGVAPVLLHTGVSSPEVGEPPFEEFYRVSEVTARRVNEARTAGGRVIAVGTTVVRALETVTDERDVVHPGEGWTRLVVTPARGVRAFDGLVTGWHEPRSSHLALIEAVSGRRALDDAYVEALRCDYLWHEFGDAHLILPS